MVTGLSSTLQQAAAFPSATIGHGSAENMNDEPLASSVRCSGLRLSSETNKQQYMLYTYVYIYIYIYTYIHTYIYTYVLESLR